VDLRLRAGSDEGVSLDNLGDLYQISEGGDLLGGFGLDR
jgi:hypothetical protein